MLINQLFDFMINLNKIFLIIYFIFEKFQVAGVKRKISHNNTLLLYNINKNIISKNVNYYIISYLLIISILIGIFKSKTLVLKNTYISIIN